VPLQSVTGFRIRLAFSVTRANIVTPSLWRDELSEGQHVGNY
jgi:hypothetical protein